MNPNLRLIGRDLRSSKGFTLCVRARNELYLISDFLNHYRALGVERFIVLDDRSEDGTREFLLAEPDVMVVESPLRFNDPVPVPKEVAPYRQTWSALELWCNQLMDIAGHGRVHVWADVDEFHVLPEGMTLQNIAAAKGGAIMGVMLDVYPRNFRELEQMTSITEGSWYFDARRHLGLRRNRRPKTIYGGARTRLYFKAGVVTPTKSNRPARRFRDFFFPELYTSCCTVKLYKTVMTYWHKSSRFIDPHDTICTRAGVYNTRFLIPIVHYKFIPPIRKKVHSAIEEGQYFNESEDYKRMAKVIKYLEGDPKGFLGPDSKPVSGWPGFERSRNAFGF